MSKAIRMAAGLLVALALLSAGWTWLTLRISYSSGERAGYVQKFSRKGWIFKTWEGELAMVNLPGAMQERFPFSVRDPKVADKLSTTMGHRVVLEYEQHRFLPTTAFAETEYFVVNVRPVADDAEPAAAGAAPASPPR